MKLTIFGASGRTGRPLVEQALGAGHDVTAFMRNPAKLQVKHDRLRIVQGDVQDATKVEEAIKGADVVLSVLGHSKDSPDNIQTVATEHIVKAMKQHGVKRIISLTGAGVKDPKDEPKLVDRAIRGLLVLLQKNLLRDAEAHAEIIQRSGLEWVIVRGPRLNEGPHTGKYRIGYIGKNSGTLASRADVADFMLKQVSDTTYLGQSPVVSY
jgi:putative NADH-flavin reductase